MAQTFFFYDLETSGLNPREDRIMQFAGRRTTIDLEPIGEPYNILVKVSDDTLPSPDAIMVTGITPQSTLADGYTEPEFCKLFVSEIATPETIMIGYNNIRFDDEFIRHTLWRNFYDPYEWAWSEGRGRWDMLDVVRMTRALRPEGMEWPVDENNKAVNKLELLAIANKLDHTKAHDAMSDVDALIQLTSLIKKKQSKLFSYIFSMRNKKQVHELISLESPQPFVYTSGRYDPAHEKTTVAYPLTKAVSPGSIIVYDTRYDPTPFLTATPKQLAEVIFAKRDQRQQEGFLALPVKELNYARSPAVAPLGVLDDATKQRLAIDLDDIQRNTTILRNNPGFADVVHEAYQLREPFPETNDVEHKLYDQFTADKDKPRINAVRNATASELADFHPEFIDKRLDVLLFRYKARNYPTTLSEDEYVEWESYRMAKLQQKLPPFLIALERLKRSGAESYVLEELHLWAESIIPNDDL
ncbi:MAG: exodeoxyribonuclease I [Candidatus Saccharimonadales bacterium]